MNGQADLADALAKLGPVALVLSGFLAFVAATASKRICFWWLIAEKDARIKELEAVVAQRDREIAALQISQARTTNSNQDVAATVVEVLRLMQAFQASGKGQTPQLP